MDSNSLCKLAMNFSVSIIQSGSIWLMSAPSMALKAAPKASSGNWKAGLLLRIDLTSVIVTPFWPSVSASYSALYNVISLIYICVRYTASKKY